MYWQPSPSHNSSVKHISVLATIEEEEEVEEDTVLDDITHTCLSATCN
jgi:hypothetical protein